jgi:hypothetical protein
VASVAYIRIRGAGCKTPSPGALLWVARTEITRSTLHRVLRNPGSEHRYHSGGPCRRPNLLWCEHAGLDERVGSKHYGFLEIDEHHFDLAGSQFERLGGILETLQARLPERAKDISRRAIAEYISGRSETDRVAAGTVQKEITVLKTPFAWPWNGNC